MAPREAARRIVLDDGLIDLRAPAAQRPCIRWRRPTPCPSSTSPLSAKASHSDLSEHERQLLHHIPAKAPGVTLGEVADHLALPRSSASVLVKDLARRGFVRRARDRADERRLALLLTAEGARRVAADSVLDPERLDAALGALEPAERAALVDALERLAAAGTAAGAPPALRARRRGRARGARS